MTRTAKGSGSSRIVGISVVALSLSLFGCGGGSGGSGSGLAGAVTSPPSAEVTPPPATQPPPTAVTPPPVTQPPPTAVTPPPSTAPDNGGTPPAQSPPTTAVTLDWLAPSENTDGTPLLDLQGYKLHYGTESKVYETSVTIDGTGVQSYVVDNLPAGTYYFAVTAFNKEGLESDYSSEVRASLN